MPCMRRTLALGVLCGAAIAAAAWKRLPASAASEPPASVPQAEPPAAAPPPAPPAVPPPVTATHPSLRFVPVSGEAPARVAPADTDSPRVVIYLHGFCSDASTVADWAPGVQRHATLIALHGELGCDGQPGRHRWGNDIRFIDYRIARAIRSVGKSLGRELDPSSVTIVGYSEGAARAESLAWLYPGRYRRAVLMSAPEPPVFDRVRRLDRLAVLRGGREYQRTYRLAAEHYDRAGVPSRYWELPGATHGELGHEGARVLREVFDFVER